MRREYIHMVYDVHVESSTEPVNRRSFSPPRLFCVPTRMEGFLRAVSARALDAATMANEASEARDACCAKYRQIFVLRAHRSILQSLGNSSFSVCPGFGTARRLHPSPLLPCAGNRKDAEAVSEMIALFRGTVSVLLRHEAAYALGQMGRVDAVPFLAALVADRSEHPITRHEAAEALAAIEAPEALEVLAAHAADAASEVSDTCKLALAQLNYKIAKGACGCERRPQEALRREAGEAPEAVDAACELRPAAPTAAVSYTYVTPAPAAKAAPAAELRAQLFDTSLPLFERYRALFALRDAVGTAAHEQSRTALRALCECLSRPRENELLKHEIAFVLGQLEDADAADALCAAVRREEEHGMVRHEAAEALGAIGSAESLAVLRQFCAHPEEILRESCWVALMWFE